MEFATTDMGNPAVHENMLKQTVSFVTTKKTLKKSRTAVTTSNIHILQGSAITNLRWGGQFIDEFSKCLHGNLSVKFLKIGWHLSELQDKYYVGVFFQCRRITAAAILDTILNFTVTVACWKGSPLGSCCWGYGPSCHMQQPFTANRSISQWRSMGLANGISIGSAVSQGSLM